MDSNYLDFAQMALNGAFGPDPFEYGTDANRAMLSQAWEQFGQHDPEHWHDYFDEHDVGGTIIERIEEAYDELRHGEAPVMSFDEAFRIEEEEHRASVTAEAPMTTDDVVLKSDDPQGALENLASLNELRAEDGKEPIVLKEETLTKLTEMGYDTSVLSGIEVDKTSEANPKALPNSETVEYGKPIEVYNNAGELDGTVVFRLDNGEPTVSYFDLNGNEISLDHVLSGVAASAGSDIESVFKEALEAEDKNGNGKIVLEEGLKSYIDKVVATKEPDVSVDKNTTDPVSAQSFEDRYNKHSEALDKYRNQVCPYSRDTIKTYHEMAKIYDAWRGGIEINGKTPNMVDVLTSVGHFLKSDLPGTLILSGIRKIIEHRNDVDRKEEVIDKVEKSADSAVDKMGFHDDGSIEKKLSPEETASLEKLREIEPTAGYRFGADMTKEVRGSTPDLVIRSTNPNNIDGRGVSVVNDNAERVIFPDYRFVTMRGENVLVDPFGKVVANDTDGGKISVGKYLAGLDDSRTPRVKEALTTYAESKGLTVEQAKEKIALETKERFCSRIENTYRIEARTIDNQLIKREQEVKVDLESKYKNLERGEKLAESSGNVERAVEIRTIKVDVQRAIETVDNRISALKERSSSLDSLADKKGPQDLDSRFKAAVESESKAVGRSPMSVEVKFDKDKADKVSTECIADIKGRVEKYNVDKPEMDKVSYDPKTATLVDRYGINDRGEYVGNTNGRFMAPEVTPPHDIESTKEFIKEHYDSSRFDVIEKAGNIEDQRPDVEQKPKLDVEQESKPDVEQESKPDVEQEPKPDVEREPKPDVEQEPKPDVEQEPKADIEQEQRPDVEQDVKDNVEADKSKDVEDKNEQSDVDQDKNFDEKDDTKDVDIPDEDQNVDVDQDDSIQDSAFQDDALDNVPDEEGINDIDEDDLADLANTDSEVENDLSEDPVDTPAEYADIDRSVEKDESDDEAVDPTDAMEAEDSGVEDDEENKQDSYSFIGNAIEDIFDYASDGFEHKIDEIEAKIDHLCDLIADIKDADSIGEAIKIVGEGVADSLADTFANSIEHDIAGPIDLAHTITEVVMDAFPDFAPEFMEGLDSKLEQASDWLHDIVDSLKDHAADQSVPDIDTSVPEVEIGNNIVATDNGIVNDITGEADGFFQDDMTADAFMSDVSVGIENNVLDLDFGDIDIPAQEFMPDSIPDSVPDSIPDTMHDLESQNMGDMVEGNLDMSKLIEGGGSAAPDSEGLAEAIEAIAALFA